MDQQEKEKFLIEMRTIIQQEIRTGVGEQFAVAFEQIDWLRTELRELRDTIDLVNIVADSSFDLMQCQAELLTKVLIEMTVMKGEIYETRIRQKS
jgi:hypothetical protein